MKTNIELPILTQRNLSFVVMRNVTSHGDHLWSALSLLAHQIYRDTQHARWWMFTISVSMIALGEDAAA